MACINALPRERSGQACCPVTAASGRAAEPSGAPRHGSGGLLRRVGTCKTIGRWRYGVEGWRSRASGLGEWPDRLVASLAAIGGGAARTARWRVVRHDMPGAVTTHGLKRWNAMACEDSSFEPKFARFQTQTLQKPKRNISVQSIGYKFYKGFGMKTWLDLGINKCQHWRNASSRKSLKMN